MHMHQIHLFFADQGAHFPHGFGAVDGPQGQQQFLGQAAGIIIALIGDHAVAVGLQHGALRGKHLSLIHIYSALSRVRTKDMGETGELITQLIGELKGFDATAENQKGFLGFFKKKSNELEALKVKYDKADVNVERIKAQLEDHQVTLMKDIAMLDKMYQLNLVYFKELSMYIPIPYTHLDVYKRQLLHYP